MPGILDVWKRLGGGPVKHGRAQAWWRDSKDWNIAIDAEKDVWYDHAHARGGRAVSLVMALRGCNSGDAGRWLREEFGPTPESYTVTGVQPHRPDPVSAAQEAYQAEAFATAMGWLIQRKLELNHSYLDGPRHDHAVLRIARLSRQVVRMKEWNRPYTLRVLHRLRRRAPDLVAYVFELYEEAQEDLAAALGVGL